ncbi:ABC-2 family transporter protein [Paraliobacillus sp. PM-2]|uniref:ABC transporter permease n=1 Tax=Paraliobacillus sp. PM-2 TaxID=1462524 RepID=UPI00061BF521|nr:ABC transporter permease [Paraliobacillus sp. PM-2]CQR48414.1 ABC-2 family transporter protein [Paraliobacillus sp. PM-2]
MKSVLLLQLTRMKRAPMLILSFFVLTILFVGMMTGFGTSDQPEMVYVYSDIEMTEWLELLNQSEEFHFKKVTEEEAKNYVQTGKLNYALEIQQNNYQFLVSTEDPKQRIVEQYVHQLFEQERAIHNINQLVNGTSIQNELEAALDDPVLTVNTKTRNTSHYSNADTNRYQVLIGMTLYFVIFTVFFHLMHIIIEKQTGTWNRLILSPIKKWQIYLGHLLYCFIIGFVQICIVFLIFHFLFGYHLNASWGAMLVSIACYVFAIVSLGMLIVGIASTPQQLQAINPIVATGMAMLGGAFWPIEAVSNPFMLAVSKGMPIFYGVEALKDTMMYNRGFDAILEPIAILVLFGVICMGIGINLMERIKQ